MMGTNSNHPAEDTAWRALQKDLDWLVVWGRKQLRIFVIATLHMADT